MREILAKKQPLCRVGHLTFHELAGFTADLTIAGESAAAQQIVVQSRCYLPVKGANPMHM